MNVNWTQINSRKQENKNEIKIKSGALTQCTAVTPHSRLSRETEDDKENRKKSEGQLFSLASKEYRHSISAKKKQKQEKKKLKASL